jgi:hypothetical protein
MQGHEGVSMRINRLPARPASLIRDFRNPNCQSGVPAKLNDSTSRFESLFRYTLWDYPVVNWELEKHLCV